MSTLLTGVLRLCGVVCCVCVGLFGVRCVVGVDVEIYIYLWCGVGRRNFSDVCWCGGEFLAGGDGWKCPNRFCLLRYPVRPCCVIIGVFCALCSFLFPTVWVMIVNYKCRCIFLGRTRLIMIVIVFLCCALTCVGFRRYWL